MAGLEGETYTLEEVATHNTAKSLWLIIDRQVYDVTAYHKRHPGGAAVMLQMAGKDATTQALAAHQKSTKPERVMKDFLIGTVCQKPRRVLPGDNRQESYGVDSLEDSREFKKTLLSSSGMQYGNMSEIDDLLCDEVLEGQDALVATADLLYQRLRQDRRLIRYFRGSPNLRLLAEYFQMFLASAFEGDWPAMRVSDTIIAGAIEDLADTLYELVREPLPLGEDPLVNSVRLLNNPDVHKDPRIIRFFEHLHQMKNDEEPTPEPAGRESKPSMRDLLRAQSNQGPAEPKPPSSAKKQGVPTKTEVPPPAAKKEPPVAKKEPPVAKKEPPREPRSKAPPMQEPVPKAAATQEAKAPPAREAKAKATAQKKEPAPKAPTPAEEPVAKPPAPAQEPKPKPPPPKKEKAKPPKKDDTVDPMQTSGERSEKSFKSQKSKASDDAFVVASDQGSNGDRRSAKTMRSSDGTGDDYEGSNADKRPSAKTMRSSDGTVDDYDNVQTSTFDELTLSSVVIQQSQEAWRLFMQRSASREAAGEAIYTALFEGAPSLQVLFTTPRAVQAMKFVNGIASFIGTLHDPPRLKILVETLGFGHLHLEVTPPRVIIFRDAIIDLFMVELGEKFTDGAREGWVSLLNYIGGAIIYVKANYAERINVLQTSWKLATKQDLSEVMSNHSEGSGGSGKSHSSPQGGGALENGNPKSMKASLSNWFFGKAHHAHEGKLGEHKDGNGTNHEEEKITDQNRLATFVPTTFDEMFRFNAAVMGFGKSEWMQQVLECFDNIVTSVANSVRFLEECEILSLRISRQMQGATHTVRLSEFKACMLASLRSLLPKDWSGAHEVAWTWLWDNTERSIESIMHNPQKYERSLSKFFGGMDEKDQYELRKEIYAAFFLAAPAGQDYFKQSNTRLHFIAEKILQMTMELIKEPKKVVDEISALGLRHVGYGIPTELFGPFVTACIEVIQERSKDSDIVLEAFRWSLGLISKTLVRTITEGSTIVMKAVNANNIKLMKKAISCAPRGQRAEWMLTIMVGTQAISPLIWAIDTGSLDAGRAMIKDLLAMRADRERYYYGMEDIFKHIPDIVEKLTSDAPSLLPTFLEGLVWRSRHTKHGLRRVNYYVKYLLVDHDGGVAGGLRALAASQDPKIMSDPVVVTVSDTMWKGLVSTEFIKRKVNFMISLLIFMVSQAILPNLEVSDSNAQKYINYVLLAGRICNYTFGMFGLGIRHGRLVYLEYKARHTFKVFKVPVPKYLQDKFQAASFVLMWLLVVMCVQEPMIHCIGSDDWPTELCENSRAVEGRYQFLCMAAMVTHWWLLSDMAVFSTGLSAFRLVCGHVLQEVSRFLIALGFLLFTFASSLSALRHEHVQFRDLANTALSLFAITLARYEGDYREINDEPMLLTGVFIFVMLSSVMLLNLLIAQINCSYEIVYQDMIGYARLNRAECIVETLENVPVHRWTRFIETVGLDTPLEFNEGDMGFAGGISTTEMANLHPTVEDRIHRYGGSCSPSMKWPDDAIDHDEDQYERLERLIHKAQKKAIAAKKHGAAAMQTTTTGPDSGISEVEFLGSQVQSSGMEEEATEFFDD